MGFQLKEVQFTVDWSARSHLVLFTPPRMNFYCEDDCLSDIVHLACFLGPLAASGVVMITLGILLVYIMGAFIQERQAMLFAT